MALAVRYIEGGRQRFLEVVYQAAQNGDPDAVKWITVFADLRPYEQAKVSFDDICAASGVRPSDLMAIAVSTAMEFGEDVGNLVAASMHPKVVRQMAKSAMRIGGANAEIALKDRIALMQHSRFLPIPRNASMHVNVNASSSANAAAAAKATTEPSVPSFAEDMSSLIGPKAQVQRVLEGSVEEPCDPQF